MKIPNKVRKFVQEHQGKTFWKKTHKGTLHEISGNKYENPALCGRDVTEFLERYGFIKKRWVELNIVYEFTDRAKGLLDG